MRAASFVRFAILAGMTVVAGATSACTASLELDRFRTQEARTVDSATSVSYFDVRFGAKGMTSHLGEYLEIRLVDRQNRLQAKAVYENVATVDFTIYLGSVVPKLNAPYRIDFWADHNNTAKYDGVEGGINEKDHAWRRVLADPMPEDIRLVGGLYDFQFVHDTAFVDIATDLQGNKITTEDTLLPFRFKVTGAGMYLDKMVETRVVEKVSGRLVGLHRLGRGRDAFTQQLLGVLDEETPYEISVYADANGDGKYSPGDPSWKLELTSTSTGIDGTIDLSKAPQAPIDTGEQKP